MPHRPGIWLCLIIFAVIAGSCQSAPDSGDAGQGDAAGDDARQTRTKPSPTRPGPAGKPLAYVNGEPIRRDAMFRPLMEAAGGQVLAELVLDRLIRDRLAQRGVELTDADIQAERRRVLATLAADEDEAARLLRELRRRRGLGEQRFQALLRRNAGLRRLVARDVQITDQTLRQAYKRRHGERYRVRLIVVPGFDQASRLRRQVMAGEARFGDLAARHSTDASADRGGLLSPISPADPSYPEGIRDALPRLAQRATADTQPNAPAVSKVIALDGQFALVKLEEKIEPESVEFADVEKALADDVRRRLERRRMRQLAQQMLSDANVTVLDPALGDRWKQQRDVLLGPR